MAKNKVKQITVSITISTNVVVSMVIWQEGKYKFMPTEREKQEIWEAIRHRKETKGELKTTIRGIDRELYGKTWEMVNPNTTMQYLFED